MNERHKYFAFSHCAITIVSSELFAVIQTRWQRDRQAEIPKTVNSNYVCIEMLYKIIFINKLFRKTQTKKKQCCVLNILPTYFPPTLLYLIIAHLKTLVHKSGAWIKKQKITTTVYNIIYTCTVKVQNRVSGSIQKHNNVNMKRL